MVVTRKGDKDEMTLQVELKEKMVPSEKGREEIEKSIREVMKLRGEVKWVPSGIILEGSKKIEDQRTWE
jgi:phenylacetate-coenzyme A ligase PaaK-like adenylate-forming protein